MRRIFWRHRWLLIFLVLLPVAAVTPILRTKPVTYAATASLQAQSAAPDAATQVTAILSRVTAVATSPPVIQTAIKSAGVNRNALTLARHDISVTSLSTSAVITLTVTDPSPQVAIRLGRALATAVVNVLNGLGTQSSQELAALATQRGQLNAARGKLLRQLSAAQAHRESGTSAGVQALITELNAVETQLTANATSVQQVLASSTVNEGAGVISAPNYAISQSRHVASYAALAGLLGLVIGMLIATIHELSRPTLAEPRAAARELSLVLLGNAQVTNEETADVDGELASRLDLAAYRLGARTLVLTGPVPPAALAALAEHLNANMPDTAEAANATGPIRADSQVPAITALPAHISPAGPQHRSPTGAYDTVSSHMLETGSSRTGPTVTALPDLTLRVRPEEPALVLVLPRFAPRNALDDAVDLGVTTGWPLLGVIGLRQHRSRRHRASAPPSSTARAAQQAVRDEAMFADDEVADDAALGQAGFADGESADESPAGRDRAALDDKVPSGAVGAAGKKSHLGAAL
jgi:hypothetical protein